MQNNAVPAAYFVWASCVFDFLDGFAARMLNVSSPIGKELDSLADVVSFGVLPAALMFQMLQVSSSNEYIPYLGFMVAAFSALRLAIFNIDETQSDSFKGLPTPANALFLTALPLLPATLHNWFNTPSLIIIVIITSLLLVSRIKLFALKFKDFGWKDNQVRFTFLAISVLLLAILQVSAIPLIIVLYVLTSVILQVVAPKA
jgi:CDP-diacylglycerol--serine O-phosphatidyltransferase